MTKTFVLLLSVCAFYTLFLEAKKYNPSSQKVLVFAPHPDDDIMGCGGSLILHKQQDAHITVVYMTSGDGASCDRTGCKNGSELAYLREQEARRAGKKIGIEELIFFREPDGRLEQSKRTIAKVIDILDKLNPEVIYIPHSNDGHRDHKTTFAIVAAALKDFMHSHDTSYKPLVLCYEVWTPLTKISHRVNISTAIELKLSALSEHASQMPSLNIVDAVKALNRYRGIMAYIGEYGECFSSYTI